MNKTYDFISINSLPRLNSKIKQSRNIDSLGSNRIRANLIEKKYWSKSWEEWIKSIRVRISIQFKNRSLINKLSSRQMNKRLDKIEPCESKIVPRKWTECVAFKWIFHGLMFFLFFFFFSDGCVDSSKSRYSDTHTHTALPLNIFTLLRAYYFHL